MKCDEHGKNGIILKSTSLCQRLTWSFTGFLWKRRAIQGFYDMSSSFCVPLGMAA